MSRQHEQVFVESVQQWQDWLEQHHSTSTGIWLVTWKKGHGPTVSYDDVVDEAMRYGWVDSQPRFLDAARSQRLLTPRRPRSGWSKVNKERIERLTAQGKMAPAGLAAVTAAQQGGSWTALDEVEALHEPDDLAHALDAAPTARTNWDQFPPSAKRAILQWISDARSQPTRAHRIRQTIDDAAAGRRANQWRPPSNSK